MRKKGKVRIEAVASGIVLEDRNLFVLHFEHFEEYKKAFQDVQDAGFTIPVPRAEILELKRLLQTFAIDLKDVQAIYVDNELVYKEPAIDEPRPLPDASQLDPVARD